MQDVGHDGGLRIVTVALCDLVCVEARPYEPERGGNVAGTRPTRTSTVLRWRKLKAELHRHAGQVFPAPSGSSSRLPFARATRNRRSPATQTPGSGLPRAFGRYGNRLIKVLVLRRMIAPRNRGIAQSTLHPHVPPTRSASRRSRSSWGASGFFSSHSVKASRRSRAASAKRSDSSSGVDFRSVLRPRRASVRSDEEGRAARSEVRAGWPILRRHRSASRTRTCRSRFHALRAPSPAAQDDAAHLRSPQTRRRFAAVVHGFSSREPAP